ncbi:MAG TPA: AraC family transcriptional regulator [Stenotrophobium sp.]|nr:AraC family transcriptional regulator [Stenotrophobium sp.]
MTATPKTPAQGWISARHLRHFVARGEAAGLQMDRLMGAAGLARSKLADADGAIPIAAIETMLAAVSARYADPLIGLHMASDIQPATFGAFGYISQACNSFADVLEVATRYNGLLSNIGRTSIVPVPGGVQLCWECVIGGEALRRQATEYVLGALVVLARALLAGHRDFLQAVHFAHARPVGPDRVREYSSFFQCPVYFEKPVSALMIPARTLKIRMRHGDAFIKQALEQHARTMLRQRHHATSLPDEVAQLIRVMIMDGAPGIDTIAGQLGISGRSLHRKLQAAGSSYRQILDQVRLELARGRLDAGMDSIRQISELLGFSSQQAFLRWFKQTAGQTPGDYRKHRQEHYPA